MAHRHRKGVGVSGKPIFSPPDGLKKWPNGHWKNWENVEPILREMIDAHGGILPGHKSFNSAGLSGLYQVIPDYFGSMEDVRKRLGVSGVKKCKSCKKVLPLSDFGNKTKENKNGVGRHSYKNSDCVDCCDWHVKNYRATWRGRSAEMTRRAKERSVKFGRDFDITKEWVFNRLVENEFKCECTGIKFDSVAQTSGAAWSYSPSLDRVDSLGGYTKDNVRIVLTMINVALNKWSDEEACLVFCEFLKKNGYHVEKRK